MMEVTDFLTGNPATRRSPRRTQFLQSPALCPCFGLNSETSAQTIRDISWQLSTWFCGMVTSDMGNNVTGPDPCFLYRFHPLIQTGCSFFPLNSVALDSFTFFLYCPDWDIQYSVEKW